MSEPALQFAKDDRQESAKADHATPIEDTPAAEPSSVDQQSRATQPGAKARSQRRELVSAQIEDAERLLAYSAEMGIEVDAKARRTVLKARGAREWDETTADQVIEAATMLAHQLKPVTPESLRDCEQHQKWAVGTYRLVAIFLAIFIVLYSTATFVTSAISEAIRKDVVIANALAVKLTDELNVFSVSPNEARTGVEPQTRVDRIAALKDLQQFAATTRAIDGRARLLEIFVFGGIESDPFKDIRGNVDKEKMTFEIPVPVPTDMSPVAAQRIGVYQRVRYFAVATDESASVFYGAVASSILPVLYAILGACAFLLRSFQKRLRERTFTFNDAHTPRVVIAAIGGTVVGLFGNFTLLQGASVQPLAIAFLVGYAVDVFFSFLDGVLPNQNSGKKPAREDKAVE